MRSLALLFALMFALMAPLAAATTVTTKSCTLGSSAIVSVGTCRVSNVANAGVRVTIYAYSTTRGDVHVDMTNSNGGSIEWECILDGSGHPCYFILDTGGPNAGVWTVTGVYAGFDRFGAPATMSVDFLNF